MASAAITVNARPRAAYLVRPALGMLLALLLAPAFSSAGPLDEMSLERWAKLREAERFQLQIAEKFYRENQFKVAADEYEKFLKLYERSEGAPFAQLKWSLCQIHLRKQNTAIKDGFQSVLDYFPESPEAISSALLIGRTYKEMGDMKSAKKAYAKVLTSYPKHLAAVLARVDLADIALKENDTTRRATLLKELTYDVERKGPAAPECVHAARLLSQHCFSSGDFNEGLRALATTSKEDDVPAHLVHPQHGNLLNIISHLTAQMDESSRKLGIKVADEAVGWLKTQVTANLKDEKRKPFAIRCWYISADVQQHARRPDKEKEVYEQMLATLGPDDTLQGKLAHWYKVANQRDLARATYLKFKDAIEGQRQVAISFVEERKFDQAVDIYRKLALSDTKRATEWQSQVAHVYRRAGKPDQAIAVYRELMVSDVKNAPAYNWEIADTLYYAHRWKEAITVYRGTERFPQSYQQMAQCNRHLKQYDEAITLYQQIMAGHPPSASWALLQIAYTNEQAGRKEQAIKVFKQVCDRFPNSGEGSTAHAHLNQAYKISVTLGGAKN